MIKDKLIDNILQKTLDLQEGFLPMALVVGDPVSSGLFKRGTASEAVKVLGQTQTVQAAHPALEK